MVVDLTRYRLADAGDGFQVGEASRRHAPRRAEMEQQSSLPLAADAGNLVQRRSRDVGRALGTMGSDGKAVSLVAQPLEVIEHRILGLEAEGRPAGTEKALAAGVAVGTLGDGAE